MLILIQCFMMIFLRMFRGDWGCGVYGTPRRQFPRKWDWAPVVKYAHFNFFAVYFEPKFLLKIKYINYSLFKLWIPLCLHPPPSIHAELIFSLVLFAIFYFYKLIKGFGQQGGSAKTAPGYLVHLLRNILFYLLWFVKIKFLNIVFLQK